MARELVVVELRRQVALEHVALGPLAARPAPGGRPGRTPRPPPGASWPRGQHRDDLVVAQLAGPLPATSSLVTAVSTIRRVADRSSSRAFIAS